MIDDELLSATLFILPMVTSSSIFVSVKNYEVLSANVHLLRVHFIEAVRRHRKFSDVTDDEIRRRCASVFTNSRLRSKQGIINENEPMDSDDEIYSDDAIYSDNSNVSVCSESM